MIEESACIEILNRFYRSVVLVLTPRTKKNVPQVPQALQTEREFQQGAPAIMKLIKQYFKKNPIWTKTMLLYFPLLISIDHILFPNKTDMSHLLLTKRSRPLISLKSN